MQSTKLYIGGLSYNSTEDSVRALFSSAGNVESVRIINDRDTGRSKGFGFVEMSDFEGAEAAIEEFNGREFEGRTLTVNEARPQAPRANRSSAW